MNAPNGPTDQPGDTVDPDDPLDTDGPAAPPRTNGELIFTSPWQSRIFGATMQLRDTGHLDWHRFRQGLIDHIASHERELAADTTHSTDDYDYWGCWQRALEDILAETGVVSGDELAARSEALAVRPAGHDHDHG